MVKVTSGYGSSQHSYTCLFICPGTSERHGGTQVSRAKLSTLLSEAQGGKNTCRASILRILKGLTDKIPLPIGSVVADICLQHLQVQRPAPVRPGAKLQLTPLDIKREPAHIDVTGAFEDPCFSEGERKNLQTQADHSPHLWETEGWGGSEISGATF